MHLFWFIFSTTQTVKGQKSQIILPGRIYYNFVKSTKPDGKSKETLRHVMVKNKNIIITLNECIYVDMIVVI